MKKAFATVLGMVGHHLMYVQSDCVSLQTTEQGIMMMSMMAEIEKGNI